MKINLMEEVYGILETEEDGCDLCDHIKNVTQEPCASCVYSGAEIGKNNYEFPKKSKRLIEMLQTNFIKKNI